MCEYAQKTCIIAHFKHGIKEIHFYKSTPYTNGIYFVDIGYITI